MGKRQHEIAIEEKERLRCADDFMRFLGDGGHILNCELSSALECRVMGADLEIPEREMRVLAQYH